MTLQHFLMAFSLFKSSLGNIQSNVFNRMLRWAIILVNPKKKHKKSNEWKKATSQPLFYRSNVIRSRFNFNLIKQYNNCRAKETPKIILKEKQNYEKQTARNISTTAISLFQYVFNLKFLNLVFNWWMFIVFDFLL